jgi:hypothetical protein
MWAVGAIKGLKIFVLDQVFGLKLTFLSQNDLDKFAVYFCKKWPQ